MAPAVQQLRHDELEESRRWLNIMVAGTDPKEDPNKLSAKWICTVKVFYNRAFHVTSHCLKPCFKQIVLPLNLSCNMLSDKVQQRDVWDLFTCVKVLVCIVEAWMCSTTRSISGLGPVTKPILRLERETRPDEQSCWHSEPRMETSHAHAQTIHNLEL